MSRRRHRTMSFSYPSQIERQIDSFLETFKRRSAAAMERAQSLQGGPGGLLSPHCFYDPGPPEGTPPPKMRSPRCSPRVKFHIPGRRSRWVWNGRSVSAGVPRSKSGVSVASSGTDSGSDSMEGVTRSLPHSLHTWASADSIPGEAAGDAGAIQAFPFISLSRRTNRRFPPCPGEIRDMPRQATGAGKAAEHSAERGDFPDVLFTDTRRRSAMGKRSEMRLR